MVYLTQNIKPHFLVGLLSRTQGITYLNPRNQRMSDGILVFLL